MITVLAAAGSLDHPEVLPGMGELDSDELGYDGRRRARRSAVGGVSAAATPRHPA